MNENLMYGKLYFKTSDGVYRKLGQIQEIKESIIKADDEVIEDAYGVPSNNYSIKHLSETGYFDQELTFDLLNDESIENILKAIDKSYNLLIQNHLALIESYWMVEFAKRYILEHYKEANNE